MPRVLALLLAFLAAPALAAGEAEVIQRQLAKTFPEVRADQLTPSPIPGLFELRIGPQVAYVSADGRFLVRGDIIDVASNDNLTEARRGAARLSAIDDVGEGRMIVFSPKQLKHTINVFTDVDCGYCRKLHSEMAKYNELGIRVRYLFYPRSGPNTESWAKAEAVWCAADRNEALTRAKRGEVVKSPKCANTPVARDFELGQEVGLRGTPAILLPNGDLLGGYLPPAMLVKRLESSGR
jgi:thiol:disulfide interchange protein DsbC